MLSRKSLRLRSVQEHGHQPIVFEPGAASRLGGHSDEGSSGTLRADMGDNQLAVVIENQSNRQPGYPWYKRQGTNTDLAWGQAAATSR